MLIQKSRSQHNLERCFVPSVLSIGTCNGHGGTRLLEELTKADMLSKGGDEPTSECLLILCSLLSVLV